MYGFIEVKEQFVSAGFSVKNFKIGHTEGSYSFDSDNTCYLGTVCHWPSSTFEFQFVEIESGDVAVLETHEFSSIDSIKIYLNELFESRLR